MREADEPLAVTIKVPAPGNALPEKRGGGETHFKPLPQNITMEQAKNELMSAPGGTVAKSWKWNGRPRDSG